jgi:Ca2+-binding EF-hand superfamily protein
MVENNAQQNIELGGAEVVQEGPQNVENWDLDIVGLARTCFDEWMKMNNKDKNNERIDIHQILIILDAVGIKKNEYEIQNKLQHLRNEGNELADDDKVNKEEFVLLVKEIKKEKAYIEEKFLAEAFSRIDTRGDGLIDFNSLKAFAKKANGDITDEEIIDMLNYFEINDDYVPSNDRKNRKLTYEQFYKLYHEG